MLAFLICALPLRLVACAKAEVEVWKKEVWLEVEASVLEAAQNVRNFGIVC